MRLPFDLSISPLSTGLVLLATVLQATSGCAPRFTGSRTVQSAAEALASQRYGESARLFEEARLEAETPEERGRATFGLAEVHFAQGEYTESLSLHRGLSEATSLSARLRLSAREGIGRNLFRLQRYEESLQALQALFDGMRQMSDVDRLGFQEPHPLLPSLLDLEVQGGFFLGLSHYQLGQVDEAAVQLERIVFRLPPSGRQAQAYQILSRAEMARGNVKKALSHLSQAFSAAPRDARELRCSILSEEAGIYESQQQSLPAVEVLLKARRTCPDRAEVEGKLRDMVGNLSDSDLEGLLRRYPHETPGDIAAYHLGRLYAEQGRVRESIDLYRKALADYSASPYQPRFRDELENLELSLTVDSRTIGFVGPLSGRFAAVGREILSGAKLAVDSYNRQHPGSPFQLLPIDDGGVPDNSRAAVESLSRDSRAIAIIGPVTTASLQVSAPLVEQLQIPMITPSATGAREAVSANRFVYRTCLLSDHQVHKIVDFAIRNRDVRRLAILYPQNSYGLAVRQEFFEAVKTFRGAVVAEAGYSPSASDFKEPLLRIKPAGPEAIFIPGEATTVALMAPQIAFHELGSVVLLGTNVLNSMQVIEIGGKHVEGFLFADDFFETSVDPLTRAFVMEYRGVYGRLPSRLAAEAYDTARLLVLKIVESGERANRSLLKRQLETTTNFDSVTGLKAFDPNGESIKELKILGIQQGRIVQVQ